LKGTILSRAFREIYDGEIKSVKLNGEHPQEVEELSRTTRITALKYN
jgi:hypothetical protein